MSSISDTATQLKRSVENAGYCFLTEFFDSAAALVRKYHLFFFPSDNSVELYDIKNKRTFLKRVAFPALALKDIYIGASLSVYGRQLKVVDFGDDATRSVLAQQKTRSLALLPPSAVKHSLGLIIDSVNKSGLVIGNMKTVYLTASQASKITSGTSSPFAKLTSSSAAEKKDRYLAMEIVGKDAQSTLASLAQADAKDGNKALSSVHTSSSTQNAALELSYFFDSGAAKSVEGTATFDNCTLCLIKPHAVKDGLAGQIIDYIQASGWEVSALEQFALDKTAAEEFLECYKSVLPDYASMVDQLASGPSIALEIRAEDAVETFREFCGPYDPAIGKLIRPKTLRAAFGSTKIENAVHCTDLAEDGQLECEFFFSLQSQRQQ